MTDGFRCPYCGGNPMELGHDAHCDGKQGGVEDARSFTAHARRTDPETSHEAAASVNVAHQRYRVGQAAIELGEFTDVALQIKVREMWPNHRFSDSGVRTRRSELVRFGAIEDTLRRVLLATRRRAIVWAASPAR